MIKLGKREDAGWNRLIFAGSLTVEKIKRAQESRKGGIFYVKNNAEICCMCCMFVV